MNDLDIVIDILHLSFKSIDSIYPDGFNEF